jgi:hypothetical protein
MGGQIMEFRKYSRECFPSITEKELKKLTKAIRASGEDEIHYIYDIVKGPIICPKSKMFCGNYCPYLLLKNNNFNFLCSGVKYPNNG